MQQPLSSVFDIDFDHVVRISFSDDFHESRKGDHAHVPTAFQTVHIRLKIPLRDPFLLYYPEERFERKSILLHTRILPPFYTVLLTIS